MAATRLIMQLGVSNNIHSSPSPSPSSCSFTKSKLVPLATRTIRGDSGHGHGHGDGVMKEKQRPAAASERNNIAVVSDRSDLQVKWGLSDLIALLSNVTNQYSIVILKKMAVIIKRRRKPIRKKLHIQMFLQKAIIDCRFFTMFAVAGTLLGSFLCFLEGCFLIIESYIHYFNSISHITLDHQGHVVHLLIEALDMFLMGTGMLVFAMGLHAMFVGSRAQQTSGSSSNLFGLFYLQKEPSWAGMKTVEEAKARIGHAVMLMLQVGLIDKFNNIPLVNGMDMVSFAAAVFLSSASVFLLSKLAIFRKQSNNNSNNNIIKGFFLFFQ